jgi:hypothetical protein
LKNRGVKYFLTLLGLFCIPLFSIYSQTFVQPALGLDLVSPTAFFGELKGGFSTETPAESTTYGRLFGTYDVSGPSVTALRPLKSDVGAETSFFIGPWVPLAGLYGGFSSPDGSTGTAYSRLSLSLTGNGEDSSIVLAADGTLWYGIGAGAELSGRLGFSSLVGPLVVKPLLGASAFYVSGLLQSWTLRPTLSLSWYPAFPIQADVGGGWEHSLDTSGSPTDSFPWSVRVAAQPGDLWGFMVSSDCESSANRFFGTFEGELTLDLARRTSYSSWIFLRSTGSFDSSASSSPTGWNLCSGVAFSF